MVSTIGIVRVTCNTGINAALPPTTMTSGASATNSSACLWVRAASPPLQRRSMRRLRPSSQPFLLQLAPEDHLAGLLLGIAVDEVGEHADMPHALALLRPRHHWPCRRAAKARELLMKLHDKLDVLDWQSRQQTRAGVLTTIRFTLNELPEEPYPEAMWQTKVDAVWAYIFSRAQQRRTGVSCTDCMTSGPAAWMVDERVTLHLSALNRRDACTLLAPR
jgi:hypothetical protein